MKTRHASNRKKEGCESQAAIACRLEKSPLYNSSRFPTYATNLPMKGVDICRTAWRRPPIVGSRSICLDYFFLRQLQVLGFVLVKEERGGKWKKKPQANDRSWRELVLKSGN